MRRRHLRLPVLLVSLTATIVNLPIVLAFLSPSVPRPSFQYHGTRKEVYTPFQIIHPYILPQDQDVTGNDRKASLWEALHQLKTAVECIASKEFAPKSEIIRITQKIPETDPLAWMHAQRVEAAAFYLCTDDYEVAAIGAASIAHELPELADLPHDCHWYGGQRFDALCNNTSAEWEDFGKAFWMIPFLELRKTPNCTTIAAHLVHDGNSWISSAREFLKLDFNDLTSPRVPPTTLPPIVSRDSNYYNDQDGPEHYENAISAALEAIEEKELEKVVLARLQRMQFAASLSSLDVVRRWKYGGHEGGHLFYLKPSHYSPEFFGCTPERLFRVLSNGSVRTEALAGTRPRGSTQESDENLLNELFNSQKDQRENRLTGDFIESAFSKLASEGLLSYDSCTASLDASNSTFFVRRLLHVQHICRLFEAQISDPSLLEATIRRLVELLHPTPAVCGLPFSKSLDFIRVHESSGFDRGFYAGPIGYLGQATADILVGIRSGIVTTSHRTSVLAAYAGGGIVSGSSFLGEFAETNYKFEVVSSLFPQSPFSIQSAPNVNVAWASTFVEELIRSGVTMFYVCPGSRSTPLVVAVARAARQYIGIVKAISVHDERSAGFRALGYGRSTGRPCAVITSSGTAVANLMPSVVEGGMDGVPMLLLTADRPYENRQTGANQAIDQVKMFSSTYVRWFRDILPPSDDITVSAALSDANHAVTVAKQLRGPVHLNIQFRENLAPEAGHVRNDERIQFTSRYNATLFTDCWTFRRFSKLGDSVVKSYQNSQLSHHAVLELVDLIVASRRGILVIGNLRSEDAVATCNLISSFALQVGFPIIAGSQNMALRFNCDAVVPFADHVLKCTEVRKNLQPDVIIQIGAPLVSTQVASLLREASSMNEFFKHVIIHPHAPGERVDPEFTVTHRFQAEVDDTIRLLMRELNLKRKMGQCYSELAPMVHIGRHLQNNMQQIISKASRAFSKRVSEPELVVGLSECLSAGDFNLFVSNSMPVRDMESFCYPFSESEMPHESFLTGTNRGASGIDGIIASSHGFLDGAEVATVLVIGDLSAVYDLTSLHGISTRKATSTSRLQSKTRPPLTTIVVNNDGGGIFSFLPISKHEDDVGFDEFFGTPTHCFSFAQAAEAFGLKYAGAETFDELQGELRELQRASTDCLFEIRVASRSDNVEIHNLITRLTDECIGDFLCSRRTPLTEGPLPVFQTSEIDVSAKTLILLHGWMGDRNEWNEVKTLLSTQLGSGWNVVSIDLPGHGDSLSTESVTLRNVQRMLSIENQHGASHSLPQVATRLLSSLSSSLEKVDAIAGYSLGGRVALEMKRQCEEGQSSLMNIETPLVLLSSCPGSLGDCDDLSFSANRAARDENMASTLVGYSCKLALHRSQQPASHLYGPWLNKWYTSRLWGNLNQNLVYPDLLQKRADALAARGCEIATIATQSSPARSRTDNWLLCDQANTLFISGELDEKYTSMGAALAAKRNVSHSVVKEAGHAVLLESPVTVATLIAQFLVEGVLPRPSSVESEVEKEFIPSTAQKWTKAPSPVFRMRSCDMDTYSLALRDPTSPSDSGVRGVGWGKQAETSALLSERRGVVVQLESEDGKGIGVGEVSPLRGLHPESFTDASLQVQKLRNMLLKDELNVPLISQHIFHFDGLLETYVNEIAAAAGIVNVFPSVRSGFEMAILSMSAHHLGSPLHQVISPSSGNIEVSGFLSRGSANTAELETFPSLKVKVGYQSMKANIEAMREALRCMEDKGRSILIRADANRAWTETEASEFVMSLERSLFNTKHIEYIEEPIAANGARFNDHIDVLEKWFEEGKVMYALDESIADLVEYHDRNFTCIKNDLIGAFKTGSRGCAAAVLKPSLLGYEMAFRIARLLREELKISAVFSSSFDSGLGLAYTALFAQASDALSSQTKIFPHGVGTYTALVGDTLNPPFSSYIDGGVVNVAALSRAIMGLRLDEMKDSLRQIAVPGPNANTASRSSFYEAVTSQSESGNEISIVASLPLPFPASVASARFTDLPQQPRWSPWLSSVAYRGSESEWTLNIRGIPLKWKARSSIVTNPHLGIKWQSVSGLRNVGVVDFVPEGPGACQMNVRMTIVPPKLLQALFRGTSLFLEEFIREKLLKWSLEMFRDVVKADLSVESGNVELGDALYESVGAKASTIEVIFENSPDLKNVTDGLGSMQ